MNSVIINEQQLQAEVDALKAQFPDTKDIYREVCVLLFFRYGITPTANKLYQYVHRGSMSAPADALNKFWLELREKSRVRIERPDIPENIATVAGDLIANLWNEAQKAAQSGFSELVDNATAEILKYKFQSEAAEQKTIKIEHSLNETQVELKETLNRLSEAENLRKVDMLALNNLEKSLKTLQNEHSNLQATFTRAQENFSNEITNISTLMTKSEERFQLHEHKYLLEIDRERQKFISLKNELNKTRSLAKSEKNAFVKEIANLNKVIFSLNNKVGELTGQSQGLKQRQAELIKQLKVIGKRSTASHKI
ncbi:MAG: DNA-binding protein [Methylotenera sp.]|nr:DNA-binding protein [Methylotenera sp.]MDP2281229.1 DNA-binding protein [Methylotenera sp.]MDP3061324.1 DNA-binding protein [Methylotenera sp.]